MKKYDSFIEMAKDTNSVDPDILKRLETIGNNAQTHANTSQRDVNDTQHAYLRNMAIFNMARVLPDQGGFRFDYYVDDHGVEHVHVRWIEKNVEAKFNLVSGFPVEIKNPRFPDHKVTEARDILQRKQNRNLLAKNIVEERERYLKKNPHLMFDKEQGKVIHKVREKKDE